MTAHQLQEAKQNFSSVAGKAAEGCPQLVTKHGKPFVVIVSAGEWYKNHEPERGIWDVLRACPADLTELVVTREKLHQKQEGLGNRGRSTTKIR